MNKEAIIQLLKKNHAHFIDQVAALNEHDFLYAAKDKWDAGMQADHMVKSVKPLVMALSLPKFLLFFLFGKSNRPSKSYEALVEKYHIKLAAGGRASGRFIAKPIGFGQKEYLLQNLELLVNRLIAHCEKYEEAALDSYILPHPLLGKLTVREMLYFTAYHVTHHSELIKKGLAEK